MLGSNQIGAIISIQPFFPPRIFFVSSPRVVVPLWGDFRGMPRPCQRRAAWGAHPLRPAVGIRRYRRRCGGRRAGVYGKVSRPQEWSKGGGYPLPPPTPSRGMATPTLLGFFCYGNEGRGQTSGLEIFRTPCPPPLSLHTSLTTGAAPLSTPRCWPSSALTRTSRHPVQEGMGPTHHTPVAQKLIILF